MNNPVKLGALTAAVMLAACATGGGTGPSPKADPNNTGYVISQDTGVVKNGFGNCYRMGYFTPSQAIAGCDDDLLPKAPPPPAQPPAPIPPPPPPAPRSEKVTYSADTFFDFDKSRLKPEGRSRLDEIVTKVRDMDLEVVVAVGHTDNVGADRYNQRLSVRRAEAVKAYLVSQGVEANRVYTEGKGEAQPVASNKTKDGRAQNRRVEVEVVGTKTLQPGERGATTQQPARQDPVQQRPALQPRPAHQHQQR